MNNRRQFLAGTAGTIAATIALSKTGNAQEKGAQEKTAKSKDNKQEPKDKKPAASPDRPEPIDKKIVGQFVGKSHGDIETVKKLLKEHPNVINATWDWGNGDWESGLGAASHVGRADIAELLLENGARLDAFAATMLGMKPVVRAMLKAVPTIHAVPGPHGICLLSHAIYGGEKADKVFELLLEKGADVNARTISKSTPLIAAASAGRANIVEVLLEKGADPTLKNSRDQSALDVAKKRKRTDVISILEKLQ